MQGMGFSLPPESMAGLPGRRSAPGVWPRRPEELRHGALSFGLQEPEPRRPRYVILYNYWSFGGV